MARLYFAYGSNMSRAQMAARCPGARPLGPARLDGWAFFINQRGTASIRPSLGNAVWGVVWRIQPQHRGVLDHYEGVRLRRYLVRDVTLETGQGRLRAFAYAGTQTSEGKPVRAYLEGVVIPAARAWDLPEPYVSELTGWFRSRPIGPARPRAPGRSWKP
ncbi:gamma-glutamylcyclotransferase family protein [Tepidamorphus sp. 3E244]|uniref:gamma-glutamylcyclotransferase family protein n=1 Tax=Tepidamorphus sp. 3E244 TaxID=3385498 RepID=UPI0038FC6107